MPGIITVGCSHTHGGVVISGSSIVTIDGLPVARVGDLIACNKHGVRPIVVANQSIVDSEGQMVAVTGARASCGAVILSNHDGKVDIDS